MVTFQKHNFTNKLATTKNRSLVRTLQYLWHERVKKKMFLIMMMMMMMMIIIVIIIIMSHDVGLYVFVYVHLCVYYHE